jgi:predicted transposase/invertase (TIGR01784 family)
MNNNTAKYLDPTNDLCFKKVFSDEARMMDFLNIILRRNSENKIIEIVFIPTEQIPDFGLGKRSVFDLKCKDQQGNIFIVEMQKKTNKHFLNRAQYYACHTYVNQIQKGSLHRGLVPVILIAVCQESVFPEEIGCISYHRLREDNTQQSYLFSTSYVFIELAKFKKTAEELSSLEDDWLYFLSKTPEAKDPPSHTKDEQILSAYRAVERFNYTTEEYDAYIRARLAEEADMLALDERYEEGMEKQKRLLAKKFLAANVPLEVVSEATGLSKLELEKLQDEKL